MLFWLYANTLIVILKKHINLFQETLIKYKKMQTVKIVVVGDHLDGLKVKLLTAYLYI